MKLRHIEREAKVMAAVAALPGRQREVFIAHARDDLPYEEIAMQTGLSISEVERQMARAITNLARQMDGYPLRWWERWF